MWLRNLTYLSLIGLGLVALAAGLFPSDESPRAVPFNPAEDAAPDFRALVEQIDASFRGQWSSSNVRPAPRAAELAVARRLALALTGTIPSLQEIRQLQAQPAGTRLAWWLAGILEDRRSADYLAERLARAYVGTEEGPFLFFRRRRFVSWLSDELAQNRPYDHIVRALIASEGLWTDRPATNFVTVTLEPENKRGPNPERLAGRVTRAFLGLRLDCARCHHHPFAPWKQRDFQGLAAFFGQTHVGFTGLSDAGGEYEAEDRKTGAKEIIAPRVPFAAELLPEDGSRRARLAHWVTDPRNPYFARAVVNRVWALLFGQPLVEPVDNLESGAEHPPALRLLADDFAAHGHDLRRLIRVLAATEVFRLDSAAEPELPEGAERAWAAFPMTRLRPEQVAGGVLQAASIQTIDAGSHVLVRLARTLQQAEFIRRYGDTGEDEFDGRGGTIPQRLLLMNGHLVQEKIKEDLFTASSQIGFLAPDDRVAVEAAYLAVLTRHPTPDEAAHFEAQLAGSRGNERGLRMADLYWALINSTEFSWNH
jgi:hypothetical protein